MSPSYRYFACFFLIIISLYACKPSSRKGAWIAEDKQAFLKYCKEARTYKNIQVSEVQITDVCNCALKKAVNTYESFREANADAIQRIGSSCGDKIRNSR